MSDLTQDSETFFNEIYLSNPVKDIPWTTGFPDLELIELARERRFIPGQSLLEVGCGTGVESIFFALQGLNVTAIDFSPVAIEKAKALADLYGVTVNFQLADVLQLPFSDVSFDIVTDRGCFHSIPEPIVSTYVDSIARVMKGGALFILRNFSDENAGTPPSARKFSSRDLMDIFSKSFDLQHMAKKVSVPVNNRFSHIFWFSLWSRIKQ